jgi:hypothetical protein
MLKPTLLIWAMFGMAAVAQEAAPPQLAARL